MLDPKFYNDAALLQSDARVENEYQEMVADVIFQSFVHFEERKVIKDGKELLVSVIVYVLSEDVRLHLGIGPGQWNRASQKVSDAIQDIVVISKNEYHELVRGKIAGYKTAQEAYPEAITSSQREENAWLEAHQSLTQDIKWTKPSGGIKRGGQPLRGYRMDFEGERMCDYEILKKFVAVHNGSENARILRKDRPF
jgi:hypothetical protein